MFTAAVLTISDKGSRGLRPDSSGPVIREIITRGRNRVIDYAIVPDEKEAIAAQLSHWADSGEIDIVFTTGGTGLSERDVTPEATLSVVDRTVPGLAEAMRAKSLEKTEMAMLSRATAGLRGRCLIINLPGSPRAVKECLEAIFPVLPHAVGIIKGEITEHAPSEAGD